MKNDTKAEALKLRQKAEEELAQKFSASEHLNSNPDMHQLIHELQVHQIELEMQNEELTRAKDESEVSRRRFTDLYDFAPSGYFTLTADGDIVQLNLCASQMVGKERSLLKNSRLGFFISEDTRSYFNNFLHNIFKYENKEFCEVEFVSKDADPIFVQLIGTLSENRELCLVSAINITERKLAEMAVIENERFLKETQMIGRLGSFSIDIEKGTWIGSEVLYLILGLNVHCDKTLAVWISIVHPDWRQLLRDYFYESAAKQSRFDMEYKIIRQDDLEERWIHAIGHIELADHAIPKNIKGTLVDITEQKLVEEAIRISEEKYRMLLELASDAFFHGNENGDFILVNSHALELTGFSRDELLTMNMKDLFSEDTLRNQPLKYKQLREGEPAVTEREVVCKDGRKIIVDMNSKMMPDGTFQSFFRDITERKRIENALKQKLHEMEIYYELAVTRERKMITLKSEINMLLGRLGEEPKY